MKRTIGTLLLLAILLTTAVGCAPVSSQTTYAGPTPVVQVAAVAAPTHMTAAIAATRTPTALPSATRIATQVATTTPTKATTATLSSDSGATAITLGEKIVISGLGASASGSTITITDGGSYRLSGALADGQIIVNASDKENVNLILDGTSITCSTSAPIYVQSAKNARIVLADGSQNYLRDGESYVFPDAETDEPTAALFSKSDLFVSGNGSLTVEGSYKHGIASKDDLEINGGYITVRAASDGIRGKDSVVITDGHITVNAAGDGLKSNNDEDSTRGYVSITGGVIHITAGQDGIDAETNVLVQAGEITISSGGGSANSPTRVTVADPRARVTTVVDDGPSTKGIKGRSSLTIEGGVIRIDALDDALHSDGVITINGGELTLATGDDAIHADNTIVINGGTIDITRCYEGIEAPVIVINDGHIRIVASDDAINAASAGGNLPMGMPPAQGRLTPASSTNRLEINGGYIVVDARGDGVAVNGSMSMTGGTLIVHGPTVNMESPVDYDRGFKMTGGFLIAAGSSGMAQAPDASSTQHAVMVNFPSTVAAGTMFHIASAKGQEIVTLLPSKQYQSVVLCSPDLKSGETYVVYTGGSSSGNAVDGVFSRGKYTGGAQFDTFTISSIVTVVGAPVRGMPGRR